MKKLLLISLLLFQFLRSEAQSWVYHPFPTAGVVWRQNSAGYECCCSDGQYQTVGDTVVSGITYHKLQSSGVVYYNNPLWAGWCSSTVQYSGSGYAGAFRNDSVNKKVYFLQPGSLSDTLFYDFDLQIGDTLPVSLINDTIFSSPPQFNYVSAIDSILVGGIYYKQFWISLDSISSPAYVSLIEGVGSSSGFMPYKLFPQFESGSNLLCQSINSIQQYPYDGGVSFCTPLTVGLGEKKIEITELYPNPTSGPIHISSEIPLSFVRVCNIFGSIVYSAVMTSNVGQIDISELADNVYFFKLYDQKGNSVVKKIIKQ